MSKARRRLRRHFASAEICAYCEALLGDDRHVDHVVPISRGGADELWNMTACCPKCNTEKADKMLHEWDAGRFSRIESSVRRKAASPEKVVLQNESTAEWIVAWEREHNELRKRSRAARPNWQPPKRVTFAEMRLNMREEFEAMVRQGEELSEAMS